LPKDPAEWLNQAEYDLNTAEYMFSGRRYFYAIFMGHLSLEKALKGLYQKKLAATPPKTHNLLYLMSKAEIKPPEEIGKFIVKLNEASVATRYPEELRNLERDFTAPIAKDMLAKTKEALEWIRSQY
jgi:HEPN domain-containing protein